MSFSALRRVTAVSQLHQSIQESFGIAARDFRIALAPRSVRKRKIRPKSNLPTLDAMAQSH